MTDLSGTIDERDADRLRARCHTKLDLQRNVTNDIRAVLLSNQFPINHLLHLDCDIEAKASRLSFKGQTLPFAHALYAHIILPLTLSQLEIADVRADLFAKHLAAFPSMTVRMNKRLLAMPDQKLERTVREMEIDAFTDGLRAEVASVITEEKLFDEVRYIGLTFVASGAAKPVGDSVFVVNPATMTFALNVVEFFVSDVEEKLLGLRKCGSSENCLEHRRAWQELVERRVSREKTVSPYEAARRYPRFSAALAEPSRS